MQLEWIERLRLPGGLHLPDLIVDKIDAFYADPFERLACLSRVKALEDASGARDEPEIEGCDAWDSHIYERSKRPIRLSISPDDQYLAMVSGGGVSVLRMPSAAAEKTRRGKAVEDDWQVVFTLDPALAPPRIDRSISWHPGLPDGNVLAVYDAADITLVCLGAGAAAPCAALRVSRWIPEDPHRAHAGSGIRGVHFLGGDRQSPPSELRPDPLDLTLLVDHTDRRPEMVRVSCADRAQGGAAAAASIGHWGDLYFPRPAGMPAPDPGAVDAEHFRMVGFAPTLDADRRAAGHVYLANLHGGGERRGAYLAANRSAAPREDGHCLHLDRELACCMESWSDGVEHAFAVGLHSRTRNLLVCELDAGRGELSPPRYLEGQAGAPRDLAFIGTGLLLTGSMRGELLLWRWRSGARVRRIVCPGWDATPGPVRRSVTSVVGTRRSSTFALVACQGFRGVQWMRQARQWSSMRALRLPPAPARAGAAGDGARPPPPRPPKALSAPGAGELASPAKRSRRGED